MPEHIGGLPPRLFLPFEIWDLILRMIRDNFRNCKSQDDLTHLWTCVRSVCKQLKAEVEDVFKSQHLPSNTLHFISDTYYAEYDTFSHSRAGIWATWDRAPLDRVEQYDFKAQLRFAGLLELDPGRAVFKIQHRPNDPNDPENLYEGVIFRHMREREGGLGPMGEADKYKPSERRRLFGQSDGWGPPSYPIQIFEPETTEGMFVIQVRAGLNDCAVPGLTIDQEQHEISLDWIGLFSRFFGERRAVNLHKGIDGGLVTTCSSANSPTKAKSHFNWLTDSGTLSAHGEKNMGRFVGSERVSAGSLRLKRNCDREVNLDDEGEVDNTIADEEALRMKKSRMGESQTTLEPMPITQRQQAIRQKQHPDYSPIAEQSLFSVAGRTAFSPRSVASSRTEEPLYTPGNTSYTDPSLSQQLPPETTAEDCDETSTKTLKKDRMRQAMEIRGHGKLIAALNRRNENGRSAKNSQVGSFQGDVEDYKTRSIDQRLNRQEKSLDPRVDDVTDD
ncbi:hypothetical protein HO173_008873 [Letharia columbiana]|uniref:Uncharacterized protein n=1 Tax=Letharia columbiana TaxID=112416 RepID=A0A8H6FQJ4_9LECA|nr:uncharacterized protein HO173_008873 [Letharia columbiana]KAF6232910.1 hypothetical protein HO173_008873 [Letharia columbiana]